VPRHSTLITLHEKIDSHPLISLYTIHTPAGQAIRSKSSQPNGCSGLSTTVLHAKKSTPAHHCERSEAILSTHSCPLRKRSIHSLLLFIASTAKQSINNATHRWLASYQLKLYQNTIFSLHNRVSVQIWQELAITLLKKYIEQFYLFYKNEFNSDHVEAIQLSGADDNFVLEYDFRLNTEEEIEEYQSKIEKLKSEVMDPAFDSIQIGTEVSAFDNLLHLYKPLVYVGKGYKEKLQVSPIPLDASEKQFLDDLITYIGTKPSHLEGKEVHVLRNQSKKGLGFFTDGNNFYPDFILWIVDGDKQIIKFIDPKGIRNSKGINDPKIQFFKVLKEKIQPQVEKAGIELDSYIVSNTKHYEIGWGSSIPLEEFHKNHVYFQYDDADRYIEAILY